MIHENLANSAVKELINYAKILVNYFSFINLVPPDVFINLISFIIKKKFPFLFSNHFMNH